MERGFGEIGNNEMLARRHGYIPDQEKGSLISTQKRKHPFSTDAAERVQRLLADYAEPRGGRPKAKGGFRGIVYIFLLVRRGRFFLCPF